MQHFDNRLGGLDPASLKMTEEKLKSYIAEVRTLRAWAYYNIYEVWGGASPLNISSGSEIMGSASENFDEGCQIIFDFLVKSWMRALNPHKEFCKQNESGCKQNY